MADISFNIACKELKLAQIAQINQLFQLLHLVHIYSHGFCEFSRMLMRKNVNNDVSKNSPIGKITEGTLSWGTVMSLLLVMECRRLYIVIALNS